MAAGGCGEMKVVSGGQTGVDRAALDAVMAVGSPSLRPESRIEHLVDGVGTLSREDRFGQPGFRCRQCRPSQVGVRKRRTDSTASAPGSLPATPRSHFA